MQLEINNGKSNASKISFHFIREIKISYGCQSVNCSSRFTCVYVDDSEISWLTGQSIKLQNHEDHYPRRWTKSGGVVELPSNQKCNVYI